MSEPIDVMDLGRAGTGFALKWLEEAKEEIARLKAENERLREGLGDLMPYLAEDEELHILGTYRDAIEQARAALKGEG
jgi:hypothetical protein